MKNEVEELKIYKMGFRWYDIPFDAYWVLTVSMKRPLNGMGITVKQTNNGDAYLEKNHIRLFPISIFDLIRDYMTNHPEIDWWDEQYSEVR